MKKFTPQRRHYFNILLNQELRQAKRAQAANRGPTKAPKQKVVAPRDIDIYRPTQHRKTTAFLQDVRAAVASGKVVVLCFRNTRNITAAAGILVLAEVERLAKRYGKHRFTAIRPTGDRRKFGEIDRVADSVLEQIGLYQALGMKAMLHPNNTPMVNCWQVVSGEVADGSAPGKMLKAIQDRIPEQSRRPLYRGAIEALSNCVEHAYTGVREDGLNIEDKRWWMFTAEIDKKLVVLVCDLGVGIPNTIRNTQTASLLELLFKTFGFEPRNDADWIKAATLVKETRTEATHRGKGGGDLRQLVRIDKSATLSIFSNRGHYRHTTLTTKSGKLQSAPEFATDRKNSILGTIVEWSTELA